MVSVTELAPGNPDLQRLIEHVRKARFAPLISLPTSRPVNPNAPASPLMPSAPASPLPPPGPTTDNISSGLRLQVPGNLAVLLAVAAVVALVARRLRYASTVRPQLLFASWIERPG
jgi:hypothetical protein